MTNALEVAPIKKNLRELFLDHFKAALDLELTATLKRDDKVYTYKYFGQQIYENMLKDGIQDGFLTPNKVKRVTTI